VRLTDLIRADFRKANMVELALGNELCHDACALLKGNALNDACGLEQVQFLGPTELGEDKIDLAFECCLSATHALTTDLRSWWWEGETYRSPYGLDGVPHYIRIEHVSPVVACAETRGAHLHREKCFVRIIRVSFEEAREKLEVGAWGIEPIEFACSLETGVLK